MNKTKTELLSNRTANATIKISQFLIKKVSTIKSLGVQTGSGHHVNELSERIASGISGVHRICLLETLLTIYNSLI